jgi:hypothetical protein
MSRAISDQKDLVSGDPPERSLVSGIEPVRGAAGSWLAEPARQLARHGISAEIEFVSPTADTASDILISNGSLSQCQSWIWRATDNLRAK